MKTARYLGNLCLVPHARALSLLPARAPSAVCEIARLSPESTTCPAVLVPAASSPPLPRTASRFPHAVRRHFSTPAASPSQTVSSAVSPTIAPPASSPASSPTAPAAHTLAMAEPLAREAARERIENLERPQLDDRAYRIITLPNKLEVLLIHEAGSDKAAAALDVNVGSFSDAKDMPGIAHAVEHLLFMGTEKYPKENAYNTYLTSHGGYSNAFTAATSTNYYFELSYQPATPDTDLDSKDDSPLWGGLDRFGQFFIAPLFLADTVDREIKAVDSENKKNLQNDTWRLHQLNKALANPDHPYCHFSTGSWKTLHDDPIARGVKIRDEFMNFHSKHYSANKMKLVVLGRESLDTLEQWVEDIFAQVPNKDLPKSRWDMPVYTEKELLTQVFAKPVLESRSLELQFLYRDEEQFYESHPSRYLSHLLGHEGPGSILAYIKEKGWANGLGAGGSTLCPGSGLFSVNVKLTDEGLKNYKEIAKIIFQYIAMIREQPPQEWVVEEQKRISEVDFRFQQKSPPSRTASGLAGVMQKPYDRTKLLSGPAVISKFDSNLISEAMSYLRPDNFRMTIVSQDFPGDWDRKEKWYGTEHKVEKIPEDFLKEIRETFESKSWPKELHFPHRNEFIPSRLDVEKKEVDTPSKAPTLIRHDDNVRIWWKKDDQFWVPKANVHIYFKTPITYVSARVVLICTLFRELVNDALVEYSYDADISGLVYDFSNHISGLSITVSGYNDKLHVLLEKVLLQVRDLQVREDRFAVIHDRMSRSLRNWDIGQPYGQVGTYSRTFKSDRSFMNEDLTKELDNVTAKDVQEFYPQILAQCQIEVLAHGNLYKEEALKITDQVIDIVKPKHLPASQIPIRRNIVLLPGSNFIYEKQLRDPANVNHCIEYSLYAGNRYDNELRAKLLLVGQMTDEPCFNQLRTIEQLGYVVFSSAAFHDTWAGYRILIQSEKDCRYLEGRIENFLNMFEKTLHEMSDADFEGHKRAIINKRLAKLKNLGQEDNRFWNHIYSDSYDFLQADTDASHIASLTKQDLTDFYAHYISPSSLTRAKISVHLQAQSRPKAPSAQEQRDAALAAVNTLLTENKTSFDADALKSRIADVPAEGLPTAVSEFLDTLDLESEPKARILDSAKAALGLADAGLPAEPQVQSEDQEGAAEGAGAGQPVLITDVYKWKAGMQVSAGVKPVRPLDEFVDIVERL